LLPIEITRADSKYIFNYYGKRIILQVYSCMGREPSLKGEVERLAIGENEPIALVPVSLLKTRLQLVQAVLYYLASPRLHERIRNKGLLLAALLTGSSQVEDTIRLLNEAYTVSHGEYYMVCLEGECASKASAGSCKPIRMEELPSDLHVAVKNLEGIMRLTR
jgi:hypothetical protein